MAVVTCVTSGGLATRREFMTNEDAFANYNLVITIPDTEYAQVTKDDGSLVRWLNPVVGGKRATVTGTRGKV